MKLKALFGFLIFFSFGPRASAEPGDCSCRPVQETWGNKQYLKNRTAAGNPRTWVFTCDYICQSDHGEEKVTATYLARRGWFSDEPAEDQIRCEGIYYKSINLTQYPWISYMAERMHSFKPNSSRSDTLREWFRGRNCR